MAIILCPECHKEVSDTVTNCPHCGYLLSGAAQRVQTPPVQTPPVQASEARCPKCGSNRITFQREQSGAVGMRQNSVTIQRTRRSRGCLYWVCIGWWWVPIRWLCFDWWYRLFFGGRRKKGWNIDTSKNLIRTMGICQDCGYAWKVK